MVDTERSTYLIFLTDGLPTEGVTDSPSILSNFNAIAPDNLRLFTFGVGYDVDTILLDSLSQDHHGRSSYVQPGMKLDEILSSFYNGISTPVLTNLELGFDGISTYDLYPYPLPDLFAGAQIVLLGRYRNGGEGDISLSGEVNGEQQTFTFTNQKFETQTPANSLQASIPRLWATRKVGYLLNQIRLQGANQEIIDQIVHLSVRYGIVTPYTSYLVTEQAPLGEAEQQRLAQDTFGKMLAMPTAAASGQLAVQSAADAGAMQGASNAPSVQGEAARTVRVVGSRTFVLSDSTWIDTAYDPDTMKTRPVEFLSAEYFTLVAEHPELADAFALGKQVIALSDGIAYEVIPGEETAKPVNITPTPATSTRPTVTPDPVSQPTESPSTVPLGKISSVCGTLALPILLVPLLVVMIKKSKHTI
jgi:Ca-activated chloride channel family protein